MLSRKMVDSFVGSSVMVEFREGPFVTACLGVLRKVGPGSYKVAGCACVYLGEFSNRDVIGMTFSPSFAEPSEKGASL